MFWGSSSSWGSLSGEPSSSSGAASVINGIFTYYVSWMMMMMILVSSSWLIQLSESFLIIPTTFTTSTIISTRHVPIHHNQQNFRDKPLSNYVYSVRRHVGITKLSSQQQNTIEEKEKQTTKTRTKKRRSWEESYQLLVSYKEKHGNCNVPTEYKDDSRLGNWVNTQRRRKDRLSDERIAKLNDLGFSWANEIFEEQWEESFQLLVSYKERNGNCNVPTEYKDDLRLGYWVSSQRKRKDGLSDERIAKLDDLGFSWANEILDEQWEEMFDRLVQYAKENNGDCNVPGNNDNNDVNRELFLWARTQRLRKSLLSKERRTKLDKLGLIWEDSSKVKGDQKWNVMYERLREYKQKYGHCRVPQKWKEDPTLGLWVYTQREKYKKSQLRKDRKIKLEEIDFTWKVRVGNSPDYVVLDSKWFVKFGTLLNFLEEHGHCDVPINYKKDKSLGLWVYTQRQKQKNGTLREEREERLDDISFTWNFDDQKDEQWNEKYQELKHFKEQNGHLRLPETSRSLITWVTEQRVQFASGKVEMKRKARLDEIGFRWKIHRKKT